MLNMTSRKFNKKYIYWGIFALFLMCVLSFISYKKGLKKETSNANHKVTFDRKGNIREVLSQKDIEKIENFQPKYDFSMVVYPSIYPNEKNIPMLQNCLGVRILTTSIKIKGCYLSDFNSFHKLGLGLDLEF